MDHSNHRDSNIAAEEILVLNAISLVSARMARSIPSVGSESYIMGCGTTNGGKVNKTEQFGIALKAIDGTDIQIPVHTTAAIIGKLVRYEETGDHNLYIFEVKKVLADEAETPLFAWKGYAEAAPAQKA